MSSAPPTIFAPNRRRAARARMSVLQGQPDAARFMLDDMIEDVQERLAFLRHPVRRDTELVRTGPSSTASLLSTGRRKNAPAGVATVRPPV